MKRKSRRRIDRCVPDEGEGNDEDDDDDDDDGGEEEVVEEGSTDVEKSAHNPHTGRERVRRNLMEEVPDTPTIEWRQIPPASMVGRF